MANIYDVPGIEGLVDSSDTTMANLRKVAFGSGLHEQAMRDYLNPFSRNKDVQIGKGAVGEYMSNFLKVINAYANPNKIGYVIFYVTNVCNFRCNFCFYSEEIQKGLKPNLMTLEEIDRFSSSLKSLPNSKS